MKPRSHSRIGAVILAAGRSARMGAPKQLLALGTGTILEQTLHNVRKSALDEVILVLGASADSIHQQLPVPILDGVTIAMNEAFEEGMASSLRAGLSALSPNAGAALIVLADQPFIQPETFDRIVEAYRHSAARIVIPTHNGSRGNPVMLDRSVFGDVMALEGDIGCRAIFASHPDEILKVEVEDSGILLDIDNRDDYERLRHLDPGR